MATYLWVNIGSGNGSFFFFFFFITWTNVDLTSLEISGIHQTAIPKENEEGIKLWFLKRKKLEHCSFKFASPTTRWSGKFVNFKLINGISLQFSSGDAKATLSAVAYAPESNTEAIYQAVAAMQALNIKGKKPGVTTHHL